MFQQPISLLLEHLVISVDLLFGTNIDTVSKNCLSLILLTVLGFAVNAVTVVMIAVVGITQQSARRSRRVGSKLNMLILVACRKQKQNLWYWSFQYFFFIPLSHLALISCSVLYGKYGFCLFGLLVDSNLE